MTQSSRQTPSTVASTPEVPLVSGQAKRQSLDQTNSTIRLETKGRPDDAFAKAALSLSASARRPTSADAEHPGKGPLRPSSLRLRMPPSPLADATPTDKDQSFSSSRMSSPRKPSLAQVALQASGMTSPRMEASQPSPTHLQDSSSPRPRKTMFGLAQIYPGDSVAPAPPPSGVDRTFADLLKDGFHKHAGPNKWHRRTHTSGLWSYKVAQLRKQSYGEKLRRRTKDGKYPGVEEGTEKCVACSREAVWAACDTFWKFDPALTGEISRGDFIKGVAERPTVEKLRFMRRARLEARLRCSASPVCLQEFLQLIWPAAGGEDLKLMLRWAQLREAYTLLRLRSFRGDEQELRRVWDLLDPHRRGEVPAGEMVRAGILSEPDVASILQKAQFSRHHDLFTIIPQEAYRQFFAPVIKQTYFVPEGQSAQHTEQEAVGISRDVATMLSGMAGGIKA
mmetsp:Transcript_28253/g.65586  ORF Transcript_28253/g.65586 Transcript_28253/m.65586 type:complete len:451 (-) Transcript_28253:57-1409(-)